MKKLLINYADKLYLKSQKLNSESGLAVGGFTEVKEFGSHSIDPDFARKNDIILRFPRGAGYWLWKPYIIFHTLRTLNDDDMLFYSDAGTEFVGSFNDYMFELCHEDPKGLILFKNNPENVNKIWTKRDCFHYMNADEEKFTDIPQLTATFQLCRKTEESLEFYRQYLEYAQDPRIITDIPNTCGLPNYPEFRDHRHDQSILSILQVKHKITTYEDPSQFGNNFREDGFKQLINHHRIKT